MRISTIAQKKISFLLFEATLDFGDPELYTETGKLVEIAKEDIKLFPDAVTYAIKES